MKAPSVSILIPVYNVEGYILRCLESVAAQTYREAPVECILVDDCGQDRSMAIAEKFIAGYAGHINFRILRQPKNMGLSEARNLALRHASGEYLFFFDSDDGITPQAIANLVRHLIKHPGTDIVQGNVAEPKNTAMSNPHFKSEYYEGDACKRILLGCNVNHATWNKLIRRNLLSENALSFEPGLYAQDYMFQFFLSKHVKSLAFDYTGTYLYTVDNPQSVSVGKSKIRQMDHMLLISEILAANIDPTEREAQIIYIFHEIFHAESFIRCAEGIDAAKREEMLMKCRDINRNLLAQTSVRRWQIKTATKLFDVLLRVAAGESRAYWLTRGLINNLLKSARKQLSN